MTRRNGGRGQVLVEFALAATVFLTLFFGIIEFGRALFAYDLVAQAARVGTRYATVNTPHSLDCSIRYDASGGTCQAQIMDYIVSKSGIAQSQLISPATTIQFGGSDPLCSTSPYPGCYVTIHLAYAFRFIMLPLGSPTLNSTSQVNLSSQ